MPRGVSSKPVFKPYQQHQMALLPPSLEDLIPSGHLVRVVSQAIDRMKLDSLVSSFDGGGASRYHPGMLLKVLVYAYTQRIYSSRQIAKAIRENIHFMWLSGGNRPDFRTINRFRSSHLKNVIDDVFISITELLLEAGLISLKDYFLDGTKIEANANKYSFVWGKSTRKFKARLQKQLRALLSEIDAISNRENLEYGDRDLAEVGEDSIPISAEEIEAKIQELEARLSSKKEDEKDGDNDNTRSDDKQRQLKKAVKKLRDDYLPRTKKYEDYEEKLGDRNSFSKTDPDATFMRMKDDHMRNGQLKAGYNLQMGTEGQFIVGFTLHQHPTDTVLMTSHLDWFYQYYGCYPDALTADSGYGSEENYSYLHDNNITPFVKYNNFHLEQKKRFKQDIFRVENLPYDESRDSYRCPAGKELSYVEDHSYTSRNGYKSSRRIYECEECTGCDLRAQCHKSKFNRRIQIGTRLNHFRQQARDLLLSPEGKKRRSLRPVEIESVFGQIKHNGGFKRFMLRGLDKVKTEIGLISIAHNLKKWTKAMENGTILAT